MDEPLCIPDGLEGTIGNFAHQAQEVRRSMPRSPGSSVISPCSKVCGRPCAIRRVRPFLAHHRTQLQAISERTRHAWLAFEPDAMRAHAREAKFPARIYRHFWVS